MRFPSVSQCCCGCTLYMGTLIIGILATVCALIATLSAIFGESSEMMVSPYVEVMLQNETLGKQHWAEFLPFMRPMFIAFDSVIAVHYAIWFVVCSTLLYGTVKSVPWCLLPWLLINFIMCVFFIIDCTIICLVVMVLFSVGFGVFALFCVFSLIMLDAYFLTVVYSFYLQLKTQQKPQFTEQPNLTV